MAMFANEYHEGSHGTGRIINTIRAGLLPDKPASWQCAKYPHIKPWMKKEYHAAVNALTNTQWGATDGDAATVQKKGKRGHPWKKTDDDLEDTDNTPTHFYLQNPDGMPISSKEIAEMSQKARMLWRMLDEDNMAPPTFGQISLKAWEFFSLTMLTDEAPRIPASLQQQGMEAPGMVHQIIPFLASQPIQSGGQRQWSG